MSALISLPTGYSKNKNHYCHPSEGWNLFFWGGGRKALSFWRSPDYSSINIGTTKNLFTARTFRTSLEGYDLKCFVSRLFRFVTPLFTICFDFFPICYGLFFTFILSLPKGCPARSSRIIVSSEKNKSLTTGSYTTMNTIIYS
jgi:hypothetical protein